MNTNRKGLIDIIANASEFEAILPYRPGEDTFMRKVADELGLMQAIKEKDPGFGKPATKAKLLLYAHFHRRPLTLDLQNDLA